jgi:hypothetical protein
VQALRHAFADLHVPGLGTNFHDLAHELMTDDMAGLHGRYQIVVHV